MFFGQAEISGFRAVIHRLIPLAVCIGLVAVSPALAALDLKFVGGNDSNVAVKGTVDLSGDDVPALKKCTATINGNVVEVAVPDGEGGKTIALQGAIIKSELTSGVFKGYIAFNDHPYLAKIDDPEVEELIEVKGGRVVSGHITEISAAGVKVGDQTIPLNSISRICSPTIFGFTCAIASQAKEVGQGFEGRSDEMQLERTTSINTDDKNKGKKRCCKFSPIVPPTKGKGKGHGGHHIHIVIPI